MDIDDILHCHQAQGHIHLYLHKTAAGRKGVVLALVGHFRSDMYGAVQGVERGIRYHGHVK